MQVPDVERPSNKNGNGKNVRTRDMGQLFFFSANAPENSDFPVKSTHTRHVDANLDRKPAALNGVFSTASMFNVLFFGSSPSRPDRPPTPHIHSTLLR